MGFAASVAGRLPRSVFAYLRSIPRRRACVFSTRRIQREWVNNITS
jgi:hypothetical protein